MERESDGPLRPITWVWPASSLPGGGRIGYSLSGCHVDVCGKAGGGGGGGHTTLVRGIDKSSLTGIKMSRKAVVIEILVFGVFVSLMICFQKFWYLKQAVIRLYCRIIPLYQQWIMKSNVSLKKREVLRVWWDNFTFKINLIQQFHCSWVFFTFLVVLAWVSFVFFLISLIFLFVTVCDRSEMACKSFVLTF